MIDNRRHPRLRSRRAWGMPARRTPGSPAIVARALFRILQDSKRLVKTPEAGFGIGIIRVEIRMKTRSQPMICLLDLVKTRLSTHAEDVIIISPRLG
jgi:hypothetical protein